MNRRTKMRLQLLWQEWFKPLLVVVLVLGSFKSAVADWNDVPTGSMKPTILEGDRIFANKLAYGLRFPFTDWWLVQWSDPARGDVVICFAPDTGDRLVKRIIGVPGDVIELRQNMLFVNGVQMAYEPLDAETVDQIPAKTQEKYRFANEIIDGRSHAMMTTPAIPAKRWAGPYIVPEGQFFMMGDNRDNSRDSRFFGCIKRDEIHARSGRVVLSLDLENWYWPRWDRFLRKIP